MRKNTVTKKSIILTVITAGLLIFIFGHSAMPAETSAQESGDVTGFLQRIADFFGIELVFADNLIRKAAHFCEYCAYGFMISATYCSYRKRLLSNLPIAFLTFVLTALTDESIQFFSPGRSAQVSDVWLDLSGAAAGLLFFAFCAYISKKIKPRKNKS
ncbi:MAG: VanZ family protein [Clostridiales bacterium]|nr:VanZ family protein [Clostridiales bacterium]